MSEEVKDVVQGEETALDSEVDIESTENKDVKKMEGEVEKSSEETTAVDKKSVTDFYNPKKKEEVIKEEPKEEVIDYKFDLKDDTFDEDFVNQYKEYAKGNKLSQEAAVKGLDVVKKALENRDKKIQELITDRVEAWAEMSRKDKEIGGKDIKAKMDSVKMFVDKFGGKEVRELLKQSGFGSHPEILRMFYRASQAFGEDNFVTDPGIQKKSNPVRKDNQGRTMIHFPSLDKK